MCDCNPNDEQKTTHKRRKENMNIKCKKCGHVRTTEEILITEANLVMLSYRDSLILNCPECGTAQRHEVV